MVVVDKGPSTAQGASGAPDPTDADLLFKEAKQRERRRRLAWLMVVIVICGVVAAVAATRSPSKPSPHRANVSSSSRPLSTGVPFGSIVTLKSAGPLAVGPTGALYVSDPTRHQVLVRLANGQFQLVAGDGTQGFAGDGGLATRAELSDVSAIAFAPNGDLYLADGSRVRTVNRKGIIRTIAGNGHSGSVSDGTPALSAPLGPVASIAFSPNGQLYIATSHLGISQLLRLTASDQLDSVAAILPPGQAVPPGALDNFGSIAVDAEGNIYASSGFDGWSVFKISPDGAATYLGYARRSGGTTAVVQRGADGVIEVDNGPNILRVVGDQLLTSIAFNSVTEINAFASDSANFFAVASNGTVYADNEAGIGPYQQIISVSNGHGVSLWRGTTG